MQSGTASNGASSVRMAGTRLDELFRIIGSLETHAAEQKGAREVLLEKLETIDSKLNTLGLDVAQDRAITSQVVASASLDRARVDKKLEELEGDVADLKSFKDRLSAKIAIAAAMIAGALYLIWNALTYFGAEVRAFIGRAIH